MLDISPYQKIDKQNAIEYLETAVTKIGTRPIKLILLVGRHGSGKTETLSTYAQKYDCPIIPVGFKISEVLQQQELNPPNIIKFLRKLSNEAQSVTLFDNIEVLFLPQLGIQAIEALKLCSRNKVIISTFPGHMTDSCLMYAGAEHNEFRTFSKYVIQDLVIFDLDGELK